MEVRISCLQMPMPDVPAHGDGCVGIVLAGGQSRRMGRDKALLEYGASTLLQHQVDTLSKVCGRVIISGVYPGYDFVRDIRPGSGPLGGMHAVAKRFNQASLLFLPVDMPAMSPEGLRILMAQSGPCHFDGQPLPCFFPIADDVANSIESLWASESLKKSVHELHSVLSSRSIPFPDPGKLENINTASQWEHFNSYR